MNRTDTNLDIVETPDFKSAGFRLTWRLTGRDTGGYPADEWRRVYAPSDEAKAWDGCEDATHCTGSRYGGYSYCHIKVTGGKPTRSPSGLWGTRCDITFLPEGRHLHGTVKGWIIVDGPWSPSIGK